jgi:cytochrome c oxidase cbb3-type subunit 3
MTEVVKRRWRLAVALAAGLVSQSRLVVAHGAADGEAVFKSRCTGCHGDKGKGNAALGTPDFSNPKTLASLTDAQVIDTITNGRKGTIMPAWKGKLSDEEIAAMPMYLRSFGR